MRTPTDGVDVMADSDASVRFRGRGTVYFRDYTEDSRGPRQENSSPDERWYRIGKTVVKEGQDVAFYTPRERHIADLHEAFRTESIDRRTFLKVAGAAAVASGLSHNAPTPTLAAPRPGLWTQPEANALGYGSPQDISHLDPHTGHDYSIAWGQKAVYDALLRYEGNPGELKPLLATEVVGSPDATTWTIKLADNATFHDGSAVTAEAVQYNFQRMLRKNLGVAFMFATVMNEDSIEVVDPTTLKINLLKPFAPYDAVLPWLFVANPKIVQEHD